MGRWINASLNDIGALTNSRVHPYKRTKPYLATLDVNGNSISPSEEVFYNSRPSRADIEIRTGDVLQAKMKATNKACFVSDDMDGWVVSTGFAQFRPETAQTEPRYFYYIISNEDFLITKDRYCVGSTQQAISDRDLKNIIVRYITSIKHQQKITAILTTIDTAIEKTESLIEKYRKIKTGLMNDLFTRGIGPEGKLRPPRSKAPELYRKTELGWIPKEWEVDIVRNAFAITSGITLGPHRHPKKNKYPYLRVGNVYREKIILNDISLLEATKEDIIKYSLEKMDLLVVEGHANVHEIGRCAIVNDDAENLLFQNHLFRLKAIKVSPYFALYFLNSNYSRKYWENQCSTSSGLNTINRTLLSKMPICIIDSIEQDAIEDRLKTISNYLEKEIIKLSKLQKQKAGLMQDLLTGKVEVTVPEEEAARV